MKILSTLPQCLYVILTMWKHLTEGEVSYCHPTLS